MGLINRKPDKELVAFQIRCAEAEKALEDCHAAFELIPVHALEKQQQWMPSEIALHLIRKAKTSVTEYSTAHWHAQ